MSTAAKKKSDQRTMTSIMISGKERRMVKAIGKENGIDQLGPVLRFCLRKVYEQQQRTKKRRKKG